MMIRLVLQILNFVMWVGIWGEHHDILLERINIIQQQHNAITDSLVYVGCTDIETECRELTQEY